jgi:NAD(P)-dependent dehydrogenase (short-subunit alcohol dehydrogenase family)
LSEFLWSQFKKLPYPDGNFKGQTIIVTGSNCGLGFEAARHFARLKASRVILACRNVQKGEAAKAEIEKSTKAENVVEVWQVDLASYDSVKSFCARAQTLQRLDVVIENAGIATPKFELCEGNESTITVNVISTFLMALLLLPKLRETAEKFNVTPRLTITSSDAHQM